MVTLKDFVKILDSTGLPVAERCFTEDDAPGLPFICYLTEGSNNFGADGIVYYSAMKVSVELYTKRKDESIEAMVENALASFYWEKSEEYIDDEDCHLTTYELEV